MFRAEGFADGGQGLDEITFGFVVFALLDEEVCEVNLERRNGAVGGEADSPIRVVVL